MHMMWAASPMIANGWVYGVAVVTEHVGYMRYLHDSLEDWRRPAVPAASRNSVLRSAECITWHDTAAVAPYTIIIIKLPN
jgi:hypothetical protein